MWSPLIAPQQCDLGPASGPLGTSGSSSADHSQTRCPLDAAWRRNELGRTRRAGRTGVPSRFWVSQFLGLSGADVARGETRSLAARLNLHQRRREPAEVRLRATPAAAGRTAWEPELAREPPGHPHPQAFLGEGGGQEAAGQGPGLGPLRLEVTSALFPAPRLAPAESGPITRPPSLPSLGVLIKLPPPPDVTAPSKPPTSLSKGTQSAGPG